MALTVDERNQFDDLEVMQMPSTIHVADDSSKSISIVEKLDSCVEYDPTKVEPIEKEHRPA